MKYLSLLLLLIPVLFIHTPVYAQSSADPTVFFCVGNNSQPPCVTIAPTSSSSTPTSFPSGSPTTSQTPLLTSPQNNPVPTTSPCITTQNATNSQNSNTIQAKRHIAGNKGFLQQFIQLLLQLLQLFFQKLGLQMPDINPNPCPTPTPLAAIPSSAPIIVPTPTIFGVTATPRGATPTIAPTLASVSQSLPWLKTSGNKIVNATTNQPVILRGANIMRSEFSNYSMAWEQKVIPELATWKGNVIERGFASNPVNSNDTQYLSDLDQYVALAQANKMYVIFIWRSDTIDGNQPNLPDASAQQALSALAARYKDKSNVMYGLQVEPHGTGSDWPTLRPLFEKMVDAIRTASAPNVPIVFVPGSNFSQNVSGAITNPVNRSNIVYKSEGYEPSSNFQPQFGQTYDAGFPVFIGEFGPCESATITDMSTLLQFTRTRSIGWAAWWMDYSGSPATCALVNQDLSVTSPWGTLIKNEMLTTPPVQ